VIEIYNETSGAGFQRIPFRGYGNIKEYLTKFSMEPAPLVLKGRESY